MKKTILITGSSTGIGFLTAKRLAQAGFTVYASMREVDAIERVINAPVGQRPLRVTVQNPFPQIEQINSLQAEMQATLFGWIGASHLLTPVVAEAPKAS